MEDYHLILHSLPCIQFAHTCIIHDRIIPHMCPDNTLEITYIANGEGCITVFEPDGAETALLIPKNSVLVTVYDKPLQFSAKDYHKHTTVGFSVDWSYTDSGGLILPRCFTFDSADNPVRAMLDQLVFQYSMDTSSSLNLSMLIELIGKVSTLYLADKQETQLSGQAIYVEKAKKYILKHLSEPIHITDVARHLDISPGYLSHLFSRILGQTFVEFINTLRIQQVEELVLSYGMGIREAGLQVGLHDPNYTSRLFRKVRGYSLSELRRTQEK